MASEAEIEFWDIDIDQNSAAAAKLGTWNLAGYSWDPVGLVATRKQVEAPGTRQMYGRNCGDDSGGSTQNPDPDMEIELQEEEDGGYVDPQLLASAPVYQPQPAGCKLLICQVAGCGLNLDGMKGYFLRHRVCEEHSKAPVLMIAGVPSRLCQQCSKFHHVSAFEDSKRTCRVQLDRIRVNKRIRRNRKLNAAAAVAFAATAGFNDTCGDAATAGEQPMQPAAVVSLRTKRPADSSGSGEGSWADSRKSRHVGGSGAHASGAARAGGVGGGGNGAAAPPAAAVAAMAAAATRAAAQADAEALQLLHESGGSDTGSREHPRASLGLSGSARWLVGTQGSPTPLSPAAVMGLADSSGGGAGGGGAGNNHAPSPGSVFTGGSQGAAADNGGSWGGGGTRGMQSSFSNPRLHHQMMRLDSSNTSSLPTSCADVGEPGSIAAAAAAGLPNQPSLTTSLQTQQAQVLSQQHQALVPPAWHHQLHQQQDSTVAPAAARGNSVEHMMAAVGSGPVAVAALGELRNGQGILGPAAASLQLPRAGSGMGVVVQAAVGVGRDSGSDGLMPDMQSLWSTKGAVTENADLLASVVAAAADRAGHGPTWPGPQPRTLAECAGGGCGGAGAVEAPIAAAALHPLLQKQLQKELMLHQAQQQKLLGGVAGQGQGQSQTPWLLSKEQQRQQAALGAADQQQQLHAAQALLHQQQKQHQALFGVPDGALVAAAGAGFHTGLASANVPSMSKAARGTGAGHATATSHYSAPSNATSQAGKATRALSGKGDAAAAGDGSRSAGRGEGNASEGTNTLSSSKLARMSLENDDALDDSGQLLGSLLDLLQTQAAEPRDGCLDPRPPSWLAAMAHRNAPTTFSGPGSPGSGNGSLGTAAVANSNNGVCGGTSGGGGGGGGGSGLQLLAGSGLLAALGGDLSSTAALSRAGSGVMGSPPNAVLTAVASAAAQGKALATVDEMAGFASSMVGAAAAAGGRNPAGGLLVGLGGLGPDTLVTAPVPLAGGGGGEVALSLRDGLLPPGLSQLQEQALLAGQLPMTSSNDLLLHQQLLMAQQQQLLQLLQQQQQLLQAQAQAHGPATATAFVGAGAPPAVPAAGLLLSRLLDADTKTQHLSTELNGCLAEKQLLRRQLLATLTSCPGPNADPVSAATGAAQVPGVPADVLPGLAPQVGIGALQMPLRGSIGGLSAASLGAAAAGAGLGGASAVGAAGLGAAAALGGALGGSAALFSSGALGGLGGLGALTAGAHGLGAMGGGGFAATQLGAMGAPLGIGGLLSATRHSAVAQLQALAEARVAATGSSLAASGPVPATAAAVAAASLAAPGGGSGAGGGYAAPDLLTRVSLKIMNCLPDELPGDVRARMQAFASQAPLDLVQGCLRPGCTEVVLDALHAGDEQRLVQDLLRCGDVDAAAAALLAALPPSLHCKDIYLQAADQALCLRPGAPPRYASWAGVGVRRGGRPVPKPELLCAESLVLQLDGADMEGCVRLRVYGRHLAEPGVELLARIGGMALQVTITPVVAAKDAAATPTDAEVAAKQDGCQPLAAVATSALYPSPAGPWTPSPSPSPSPSSPSPRPTASPPPLQSSDDAPYDLYDVEIQMPYNAPPQGLLILEPRAGVLLGAWAPVLLLEDADVAAEAEALLRHLDSEAARRLAVSWGLFVDHAERCAAFLAEAEDEGEEAAGGGEGRRGGGGAGDEEEETDCLRRSSLSNMRAASGKELSEEMDEGAASSWLEAAKPPSRWGEVFGAAHGRVVQMGRTLLAYSALRGCPQLMSYIGAQLAEMGEPLASLASAEYGGCPLVACATLSGSLQALCIAAEWATRGGDAIDWRAPVLGQPAGATLLHLAATSLPLPLALAALNVLWTAANTINGAVAKARPAGAASAESFASAWFANDGVGLDPPSALFRALVNVATATAIPATAAAAVALSAAVLADDLDRLCLLRLAASYIRTHNFTSPLDNVELPSMEGNSCAAPSGASGNGGNGDGSCGLEGDGEGEAVATAAAVCGLGEVAPGMFDSLMDGDGDGDDDGGEEEQERTRSRVRDLEEPDYVTCRTRSAALLAVEMPATATGSRPDGGAGGADRSGHGSSAAGREGQVQVTTASPPRMRVAVAPKAVAQTAAAAAASRHASASDAGCSSWMCTGSGADASLVPPSATTNATTTVFASGSMPVFDGSAATAGTAVYGSSLASYNQQAQVAGGKPLPLEPLLNMYRPLPGSPSSGPETRQLHNCSGAGGCADGDGGGASQRLDKALAVATATTPGGALAGQSFLDAAASGDESWIGRSASCSDVTANRNRVLSSNGASHPGSSHPGSSAPQEGPGPVRPATETGASEAPQPRPAAEGPAAVSEPRRGHMKGLARMFRRLLFKGGKGGSVEAAAVPQDE